MGVGASVENPVTGSKADALLAAHLASEAALRLVKPGNETYEVTETVSKVGEAFDCKPVEGMLLHQLEQNKIDGEKTIIQNPSEAQRKEHDKYKMAAEIVNKVLKELADASKLAASVRDLCILGDKRLAEETGKAFKKDKKLTKGIAFPM